jgi:hypothetical protein
VAKKKTSAGQRSALGFAVFAIGLGVAALGLHLLELKPDKLAAGEFALLPLGMTIAFGGALRALPQNLARTRALVAALMITALAVAASWIAFGPGDSGLRNGFSLSGARGPMQTGHMLGRILFGIAAVLADLLAFWAWVRFLVSLGGGATAASKR